ncbi:zinc-finger-containing protein [Pseudobacillus badius]|uniref:zinc-finger-containing protein n=1 Tax=Bacillus badius TaxID=1455 RepID=UPI0007B3412F|nr:zinc-finger-containing protein [Bacillus badius]
MVTCPYCGNAAKFMTSKEFYGKDYGSNLYVCKPCDARIGTHRNSKTPLGTLANDELRRLRITCHSLIDPYWKYGKYSRSEVYRRMSKAMNLPQEKTHIGMFNKEQCLKLISFFYRK